MSLAVDFEDPIEREQDRRERGGPSSVYFIRSGSKVKIGTSIDVDERVKNIQATSPEPVTLLGTVPGGYAEERKLHVYFARHRIHGEWFHADEEILSFIRGVSKEDPREAERTTHVMGPDNLTDRQRAVLTFIRDQVSQRGMPPTLREIGRHMRIRSTNGVNDHLRALERKGFITRENMMSRGMKIRSEAKYEGDDRPPVDARIKPLIADVRALSEKLAEVLGVLLDIEAGR